MFYRNFFAQNCYTSLFWTPWNILLFSAVFILIAVIVVLLVHKNKRTESGTALQELKMKLARGEITPEEYEKRKSVLMEL